MYTPSRWRAGLPALAAALWLTLWAPAAPLVAEDSGEHMAVEFYRTLAEEGSADAQLTLGDLYANGSGVPLDLVEAYAWYYLAAQQGLEEAIRPMNDVVRALPPAEWIRARQLAETYERHFLPRTQ